MSSEDAVVARPQGLGSAFPSQIDGRLVVAYERASRVLAWVTAAIGAAGVLGWLVGSETLTSGLAGYPSMKLNTAGGLLLAGLALRCMARHAPPVARRLGAALAVLAGLDGGLALVEHVLGTDLGIDQVLLHDPSFAAGRMAPITALSFVLASVALLTLETEVADYLVGATLATVWLALAWLRLVAYLFGGTAFIGNPLWSTMAIQTATAFLCLALGEIAARPERGRMRLFVSGGGGGATARRLVPTASLLPLLLGVCAILGERLGYYDQGYRLALTVIGMTIVFVALLLRHGYVEEAADLARRRAEERLAHSEQRWRTIADQVTDVVARVRLDGTIGYLSQAARPVLGYEPAELVGRNACETLVEEDVPLVRKESLAAGASGRMHVVRFRLRHKDGPTLWLETTFRLVPSLESPDLQEIVAVSRDVTAQVEIERMRNDFIAMLSHDLKNPLGVLRVYLEILDEESDAAKRLDTTARMRTILDGALRIARNMVDAIRIDSGSLPIARKPSLLDVIVSDVVRRQESAARLKDVAIDLRSGGIPTSWLDAALIERALDNLLGNAIEFAPAGSRIDVHTSIDGGQACVAIRDRGPGIAAETRAALFGRFQSDAKSYHDSTGLGLFIVRSVVEAHGGSVIYESPAGGGAQFCVHLPLEAHPD